jgi:hypothetical protein
MSESIDQIRRQIKARQISSIQSLSPGRKLDALIAKHVMGLHIEEWKSAPEEPLDYWYRLKTGLKNIHNEEVERVPNYSTVYFSAEKILAKFKHWRIQSESTGIGAVFSVSDSEGTAIEGCLSIPEAICKAALAALIDSNKIIDELIQEPEPNN